MTPYASICDDFGLYLYLNTEMPLPQGRETVLHYFDTIKRHYPDMTHFHTRENGEFALEEEKEKGHNRFATLESKRLCSGYNNPPSLAEADTHHLKILEFAPFHFGINGLDIDALDVVFAFDFIHSGNHDEAVAEALGLNTSLESLLNLPAARVIKFEPSVMLALDEPMKLQCRLNVETRTSAYQVKTGQFNAEPISIYFTVRQYWQGGGIDELAESYQRQRQRCQDLVDEHVVPAIIQPLVQVIGGK
jgi:hypothetical protein